MATQRTILNFVSFMINKQNCVALMEISNIVDIWIYV